MSESLPSVSVVIPSYNEGMDLIRCLEHVIDQSRPFESVVVVDDSSDNTPELVRERMGEKVKLIHRPAPMGRCSARNEGVAAATGEIVVILNADVFVPQDFCERVARRYAESGCDALGVELEITNLGHPWPRYLTANHKRYGGKVGWTEGFSVRRALFNRTKGFPDGFPKPLLAGEDVAFFDELKSLGAVMAFEPSIIVKTVMPENDREIVSQIAGRASLRTHHFVKDLSVGRLFFHTLGRTVRRGLALALVAPWVWSAFSMARRSPRGLGDWPVFMRYQAWFYHIGICQAWKDIIDLTRLHLGRGATWWQVISRPPSELGRVPSTKLSSHSHPA